MMNDDEVITAVREQRDRVHSHTSAGQIISRGRTIRSRRRAPGAVGGLTVVAAAVAVLGLVLSGAFGSAPARGTGTIRTEAFTLVEHANGTATLTINPKVLLEPGTLQSDLQHDGIPAIVTTGSFCSSDPIPAGFLQVVSATSHGVTINPAAMPAGTRLSFGNFQLRGGGGKTAIELIDAHSYTCASTWPAQPRSGGGLAVEWGTGEPAGS
jgi:hypothetical protein